MSNDAARINTGTLADQPEAGLPLNLHHRAIFIVGSYAVLAGLYITLSDHLLGLLIKDKNMIVTLSVYKGYAFIAVTATLLYLMLDSTFKLIRTTFSELEKKEAERRQAERLLREANESLEKTVEMRTHALQDALEEARSADRLKSAFLATMSHELRTPLNSIIGFTGILRQNLAGPLNDEQQKQLAMISKSANHLLSLINDVLDLSKIEARQLQLSIEPFDLKTSIEKVVKTFSPMLAEKQLELAVKLSLGSGMIVSDQRRIEQIMMNLLSNAVKFTEKGKVTLSATRKDDRIIVEISDTGIGIRKEDIDTLFKPFSQIENQLSRRFDGTGLGLSICKRLIDLLKGKIWVESEWNRGSCFGFELPANQDISSMKPSDHSNDS
ncbi:MAG: hypothetical protein GQF41_2216 [Candidatus Rifleibacterium amylolyticum]|nr:MAG: hypothetical protein GQF41_2216 [Candidatus Rifleibacterium amylolyticum]